MSQNRTLREKIVLALAGSLVLTYVFVEYVGEPLYLKQKSQEQKIESKILFITKYHEILNQTAYFREKEETNQRLSAQLEKLFLSPLNLLWLRQACRNRWKTKPGRLESIWFR